MSTRLERFQKRKRLQESITMMETNKSIQDAADKFLNSNLDGNKVNATFYTTKEFYDMSISQAEIDTFLSDFKEKFNDQMFNKLVSDCKKEVINSIVTPFGLGKVVAAYDKTGGNVDTIHNVRHGIYATDKERNAYEQREQYNSEAYHKDTKYIEINKQYSQAKKNGGTGDYITGETITQHDKHDLDHVVSAKEIHDDRGRILAEVDGIKLANTKTNLKPTDSGINRSKKADSMSDFLIKKNERIQKIQELKSKKTLNPKEERELKKLEKFKQIDDKKAMQSDKEARAKQDSEINKEYYTSTKFAKNTAIAGVNEGKKMGMQQALGLLTLEFFTAVFDELVDIYKNGFSNGFDNDKFFTILKKRLKKISIRVAKKWEEAAIAFKDGFISGFISNLVTTVINMFTKTVERTVRIIREGIFSLFRAVRLLLFPPENMTYEEAMHEAKKLLATGLIVSLGVIAEEYIDILIKGTAILEPFADILTSVFVGAITGLSITMVVYYIDKKRNDKEMFNSLVNDTNSKFDKLDDLLSPLKYEAPSPQMVSIRNK